MLALIGEPPGSWFGILLYLAAGALLLWVGAEWIVRGSGNLARRLGISPLLVGATVVAFGTSAPEWVVSISAQLRGETDAALGNIVGSNIANLALVLGLTAVVLPMPMDRGVFRRELPLVVLAELVFWGLAGQGSLILGHGLILLTFFLLLYYFLCRGALRDRELVEAITGREDRLKPGKTRTNAFLLGLGLIVLVSGAQVFIGGAKGAGIGLGLSQEEVGLFILAFGTSLPELVTSLVAALRGETCISIGTLLGSNFFNVLFVGGSLASIGEVPVPQGQLAFHMPFMVGITLLLFPLSLLGRRLHLGRAAGVVLLLSQALWITGTFLIRDFE